MEPTLEFPARCPVMAPATFSFILCVTVSSVITVVLKEWKANFLGLPVSSWSESVIQASRNCLNCFVAVLLANDLKVKPSGKFKLGWIGTMRVDCVVFPLSLNISNQQGSSRPLYCPYSTTSIRWCYWKRCQSWLRQFGVSSLAQRT